jgi:hypothetical protein
MMNFAKLDSFRSEVSDRLKEAACEAKVDLLPVDVALSIRDEYVIANALIAPPNGTRPEYAQKMFLVYLSLPEKHEMAKKIPKGCYIIERIPDAPNPRARVVNLKGETVHELPLNIIRTELPPDSYQWVGGDGPVQYSQAIIEQSHATLYRDVAIQAHGIICYPGVWYWTWVVIVIVVSRG